MTGVMSDAPNVEAMIPTASCLSKLRKLYDALRPAQRKVASFILENGNQVVYQSITELSSATGTSDATIIRLCNTLGYSGYQELKIALARELVSPDRNIHEDILPSDSLPVAVRKAFRSNIQAISDTIDVLDLGALQEAVSKISRAKQVYLYGVGTSSLAAQDAYYKLLRVGIHANFYSDPHMQAISTALISPGDVAIGFSHSGSTKDVVDVLTLARSRGAHIVCITNRARSPVAKLADIVLRTASEETPFGSGGMPSMMAQLSVVDALFVGISLAIYDRAIEFIERTGETVKNKKY
ncbi:MAG: MurR/RpiR family transcriptional regulator [Clostridia bacterium]|nr:MurR/RpiR family transcriptional regulator [Clostridia bacterium]